MARLPVIALLVPLITACGMTQKPAPVEDAGGTGKTPSRKIPASESVKTRSGFYAVKAGDTLYQIAFDHGLDYRELAGWNGMDDPNRLRVGEILRLTPPQKPVAVSPALASRPSQVASPTKEPNRKTPASPKRTPGKTAIPQPGVHPPGVSAVPVSVATSPSPVGKPAAAPDPAIPRGASAVPPAWDADEPPDSWHWPARGNILQGFDEARGSKGLDIAGARGSPVMAAAPGKVVYAGAGLRGYGKLIIIKHSKTLLSAYGHLERIRVREGEAVAGGRPVGDMGDSDADRVRLHFEIREYGIPVDPIKYLPKME